MSTKKYANVDEIFSQLIKLWNVKGYKGLASHIDVPYQTLMAWKKRKKIGDYSVFMDKGISKVWLETGEGDIQTTPDPFPHGVEKFQQFSQRMQEQEAPRISELLTGYSKDVKMICDSLEIAVQGKTTEERQKFVQGIMEKIWGGK